MFATELRNLCNKKSWRLPIYSIKKQGPDHVPRFSSTVSVNGKDFHSPKPSKNKKGAQNEAAEVALKYFSTTDTRPSISMGCLGRLTDSPDHESSNVDLGKFPKMSFKSLKYITKEEGPDHIACLSGAVTDKTSNKAQNGTTKLASNHLCIDYTKAPSPKASSFPQPSLTLSSDCLTRPTAANQDSSHVEQINQMEVFSSEANTEQGIPANMKRRHNDLVTTDRIAKRRCQECSKSLGLKAEPAEKNYSKKALEQLSSEKAGSSNSSGEKLSDSTLLSDPILDIKLILNPEEKDQTKPHNTAKTSNEAQNETAKLSVNHFFIDYTKPPIPSASSFPQPSLVLPSDCLTRPAAANQQSSHVEQINQMEKISSETNTDQGMPANLKRRCNELVTTDQIAKRRRQKCSKSRGLKAETVDLDHYSKKALEQLSTEKGGSRNPTGEQMSDSTLLSDPILETKSIHNPEEQDKTKTHNTAKTSNKAQNETSKLAANHFFIDYTKPPNPSTSSFPQPSLTLPSDCLTRPAAANQQSSHVEQINQMEKISSETNTDQGMPANLKRRCNELVTTDQIAKRRRQKCSKSRGLKAETVDLDHYSKKALEQLSTEKGGSRNPTGEQMSDSTLLSDPILETKSIHNPEEQDKTKTHNTAKTSNKAQNETSKLAANHFFIDYTKPPNPSTSSFPQPSLTLPSDCLTRPAAANQESSRVEQINQMEDFSSEGNTEQGIPANVKRRCNELVTTDQIAKRTGQEGSKSQGMKAEPVDLDHYSKKALEQLSSEKGGSRNSTGEQISDSTLLSDPILETKLILNPEEQDKIISLSPISLFQVCMKAFVKADNQIKRLSMELKESEKKHKKELEEMKKKHEEEIKEIRDKRENGKKIWERSSKKY